MMYMSNKPQTDLTDILLYYPHLVLFADVLSPYLQGHCGEAGKNNRSRTTLSKDKCTGSRISSLGTCSTQGKRINENQHLYGLPMCFWGVSGSRNVMERMGFFTSAGQSIYSL